MRSRSSRNHGFTIGEMVLYLGLLSTFLAVSAPLFQTTWKTTQRAAEAQSALTRFDSAIRLLRADVWNSVNTSTPDPRTAVIEQDKGAVVSWRLGDDAALTRQLRHEGKVIEHQEWPDMPAELSFRTDDDGLAVRAMGARKEMEELRLFSQVRMLRRARP